MLNDDEVEEVKDTKSYVQLPISSVKGRWNDGEKQRQKAEEDRIKVLPLYFYQTQYLHQFEH